MRAQLIAALEESLRQAPDPDEILRGVHVRIRRRRQRRRLVLACASLGTVAVVLAVSIATLSIRPAVFSPGPYDWAVTLEPDWLPNGMVLSSMWSGATGEGLSYRAERASLHISHDTLTTAVDQPGWEHIEVNGETAWVESQATQALVVFRSPTGGRVDVRYAAGSLASLPGAAEYRTGAVRVAQSLRFDAHRPVRVGFAARSLPAPMTVVAVSANLETPGQGHLGYATGPGDQQTPAGVGVAIVVDNRAALMPVTPTRRADIQGRPAYVAQGGRSIIVTDFHGGALRIDALYDGRDPEPSDPVLSEDELVMVAENVPWGG